MNLNDADITEKIHLNYRLTYLRDTALATGLDETNIQVIGNLISTNNTDVVQCILLDQEGINKVFNQLEDKDMDVRKEAISFISEIFTLSKSLQMQGRMNLMSSFKNIEEFNMSVFVRNCLDLKVEMSKSETKTEEDVKETDKLVVNCLDILQNYLQSFPISLSDLCAGNTTINENIKLLKALSEHLISSNCPGLKLQIHELLKFILESDNNLGVMFYQASFPIFSEYLPKELIENDKEGNDLIDLTKSLIIDIINKSIMEDNYNVKGYIDTFDIIAKVNKMAKCNSKIQNMSILKFYKSLITTNFKHYVTEIMKLNF